jgi:tetratricopeptide (TPR) repeat protein
VAVKLLVLVILVLGLGVGLPTVSSGAVSSTNATAVAAKGTNDPVEVEFRRLMAADDEAQEEVERWIKENDEFAAKGAGTSSAGLNRRILERLEPVKKGYEDFLKRNPNHVRARVAYGSFLGDINDEEAAQIQLEKALELDAKDPVVYNNLAGIYGHIGPDVKKAFEYYAKAIELAPSEPLYYRNYGTTVFMFRADAKEYFKVDEQQVFDKAMGLYDKALKLDPKNFELATWVAQSYYGITPVRLEAALNSWTNALSLAANEAEREGVHVHLARFKLNAGRFEEARAHLNLVTNANFNELKARLMRNLSEKEKETKEGAANGGKGTIK